MEKQKHKPKKQKNKQKKQKKEQQHQKKQINKQKNKQTKTKNIARIASLLQIPQTVKLNSKKSKELNKYRKGKSPPCLVCSISLPVAKVVKWITLFALKSFHSLHSQE